MFRTHYDETKKLWTGNELSPLYNPNVSIGEIVFRALITNGPRIAQISDDCGVQMSFDEIRLKAIRAAINLQKLGYQPENIFGLVAKNSKNVAPIVFASLFIGCPLNTFDPSFGKTEIIHMLKTTKPSLMFCDVGIYDLVEECLKELKSEAKIFTLGGQKGSSHNVEDLFGPINNENQFLPVKVDGENHIALILCSSGTTGPSKGVCLTHAVLINQIAEFSMVNADDVMLSFSLLYWVTGILTLFTGTIFGAKRIITTESFSPKLEFRLIEAYKVTYLLNPPYHIALILKSDEVHKADLTSVKYQLVGGSKVPLDMPEKWNKFLSGGNKVHVIYGFTESGIVISVDYPESKKKGTVGQLTNDCHAKIIDDNGHRCGPNVSGEICIKPKYKFYGYCNNEKASHEMIDDEGFLLSGDIGYFDDDGHLFVIDRKKDLLKYQSFQLTPTEIEEVLIKHPDIESVCVIGIQDGMGSDLPAAAVIRNKNAKITELEVFNIIADHFADYYKLRGGVYFVDSFPISSSGKLMRRKVKDLIMKLKIGGME